VPELPETETIARDLHAMVAGATIIGTTVPHGDVLRLASAETLATRVRDAQITHVWRRAKLVLLSLSSGETLAVQPRFTGALLVESSARPITDRDRRYVAVSWSLADGRRLHYRDIRRLGTVTLFTQAALAAVLATLGPEPLDDALTAERFSVSLRKSGQPIKKVLMDQRMLAGVGNIYANEACWRAGIDPSRAASALSATEGATLLSAIRAVLSESIALRGTSFRDYVDASGGQGGFVPRLAVYGRGGLPCTRCRTPLVNTDAIDGRTTVFCWRCQA
jgi:formamidopyrimidine-DNA glycosylase